MKIAAQQHNAGPGTTHTTNSLLAHEHGGGAPGESKYYIAWQVRNSKTPNKIDADLGGHAKRWAASVFMTDIKADIVTTMNTHWTAKHAPLQPEHVSFRWAGNKLLDHDTATLRLGDFYTHYNTPSKVPLYLSDVPLAFKHLRKTKLPVLCFDMYIDYALVRDSILPRKRMRASSSAAVSQVQSVRPRRNLTGAALVSHFSLSTRAGPSEVHRQSAVVLKKVTCVADNTTGVCKLIDEDITVMGNVLATPFSSGAMKEAYDLITADGEQLVGKRFVRLTNDEDAGVNHIVSLEQNRVEVEGELFRLTQGKWFLDKFYNFCQARSHVGIDQNICFASAYLAQETGTFSVASGIDSFDSEGITWLVEQKRPTTVIKFTGTLNHRQRQKDMRGLTVQAFSHFVYGYSKQTLVFSDLQGSLAHVKGRDGLVLFDVMTHTIEGNSGVGDFGKAGIKSFVDQHVCNDVCLALALDKTMPLVTVPNGGESVTDEDTASPASSA
ncbi:hypothetical protein HYPSUDRAFT_1090968 [Hypholoma sublateritium FD-334 SS-4]|uniref:Alpha-type protein kinase domain-containing protein n=1 Tax=Hypholoma sublateritium (strain FD-334 SS-4) TaxID=945553 RepID=A0A0D2NVE3_HYPSF|nr:hypothetical protein HYPSUDRAFT_1090968 [Hypholoma sublateritium FD-334 SS-4]